MQLYCNKLFMSVSHLTSLNPRLAVTAPSRPRSPGTALAGPIQGHPPTPKTQRYKHFGIALGLLGTGFLLRKVPASPSTFKYLSTDIKDWIRIALGIGVVRQVNKGLDYKPPAWVNTLETLAVMTPLSLGFSRQMLPHLGLMAIVLPPLVEATSRINRKIETTLEKNKNLPPWVHHAAQIGMSIASIALGILVYPKLFSGIAKTGILGKTAQNEAALGSTIAGVETGSCLNGCCSSAVCMTEIADISGSMFSSLKDKFHIFGSHQR